MKLDHVVYFTSKEPQKIIEEQKKEGHHVVAGGRHVKWGTRNALRYTRNAYIEWLSIEHPEVAENADQQLTKQLIHRLKKTGEGWGTICISVDDITLFDYEIKKKGFKTSGIVNGERRTPAGKVLRWKLLFVDQPDYDKLPSPFFIQWDEPEEVRLQRLREEGFIKKEGDACQIKECIFRTGNPVREMAHWSFLLGQKAGYPPLIRLSNVHLRFVQNEKSEHEGLFKVVIS